MVDMAVYLLVMQKS